MLALTLEHRLGSQRKYPSSCPQRGFSLIKKMTKIESAMLELQRGFRNTWIREQLQLSLIHLTQGMGSVLGLGGKKAESNRLVFEK